MATTLSSDEHNIVFGNTNPRIKPGMTNTEKGSSIVFNSDATNTTKPETGGIKVPPGSSGSQGTAVQGADGQSSTGTGASSTVNQNNTQIWQNGQLVSQTSSGGNTADSDMERRTEGGSWPANDAAAAEKLKQAQAEANGDVKPVRETGGIKAPPSFSSTEGTATPGTPGQSISTPGASLQSNTSHVQSTNTNNLSSPPGSVNNTGANGISVSTGQVVSGQNGGSSVSSPAAVGAAGQSSSSTGANQTSIHTDSQTNTNNYISSAPKGPLADTTDLSNNSAPKGPLSDAEARIAQDVDTDGTVHVPATDEQGSEIETSPVDGGSSQPADSTPDTTGDTGGISQPNPTNTSDDLPTYGGTTPPEGTVTASGGNPGGILNGSNGGGNDHVSINNGQVDIVKGAVSIKTGLDGSTTIRNGDLNITTGPDGSARVQAGGVNIDTNALANGFPTSSTYAAAQTGVQTGGRQMVQPPNGWGSSDTMPPDPVNGVLGSAKNRFTNPLESKNSDKDD